MTSCLVIVHRNDFIDMSVLFLKMIRITILRNSNFIVNFVISGLVKKSSYRLDTRVVNGSQT